MPKLLLIRGLPGSGKSTLAMREYVPQGYVHCEADLYFYKKGKYAYDPALRLEAHKWCRDQAYRWLLAGRDVVVSNCFSRKWEVEPYRALARALNADLQIITLKTQFESTHLRNKTKFEEIKSRWEEEV